jgi:hypothetical protein
LDKLEFYGKFKTLIESYLTCRHQKVILDNRVDSGISSKWETTTCSVSQGSILGPLFFLLYINDLAKTTTTTTTTTTT